MLSNKAYQYLFGDKGRLSLLLLLAFFLWVGGMQHQNFLAFYFCVWVLMLYGLSSWISLFSFSVIKMLEQCALCACCFSFFSLHSSLSTTLFSFVGGNIVFWGCRYGGGAFIYGSTLIAWLFVALMPWLIKICPLVWGGALGGTVRLVHAKELLIFLAKKPLWGCGVNSTPLLGNNLLFSPLSFPHNFALQLWLEGGGILILLIAVFLIWGMQSWRAFPDKFGNAFQGVMIAGLLQIFWYKNFWAWEVQIFWALLSIGLCFTITRVLYVSR